MYNFIKNLEGIPTLTQEQKLNYKKSSILTGIYSSITYGYNNWFLIDNNPFYYKKITYVNQLLNELIGSYLAKYFNLPTVNYEIVQYRDNIGIISKNFRKENKIYLDCREFSICNTNEISLMHLKEICQNNYKKLVEQILVMTVFDFYRNELDRNGLNLYFEKSNNNISLAPLFDYESSFEKNYDIMHNVVFDFDLPMEKNFITQYTYEIYKYFKNFPAFYNSFREILNIDLEEIIKMIISDYNLNISSEIIDKYLKLDEEKKQYVKRLI